MEKESVGLGSEGGPRSHRSEGVLSSGGSARCIYCVLLWCNGEGDGAPSSPLTWKIPWTEEPGGLQPMGSRRVGHD